MLYLIFPLLNMQKETLSTIRSFCLQGSGLKSKHWVPPEILSFFRYSVFACEEGRGWIVASECGSGFKPAWVVAVCASARLWC